MRKKRGKKKYIRIILFPIALCLVGILCLFIRSHLLTMNNYFINVDESEQVYEIVASEFLTTETTKTEVQTALAEGIFDNIDCDNYQFPENTYSNSRMICDALGSTRLLFPKYYRISFGFQENVLTKIEVDAFFPNAP